MTIQRKAIYDGKVLQLDEPLELAPNTEVTITLEVVEDNASDQPKSFLDVAESLRLQGPPDWSARIDDYLYGTDNGAQP